MHLLDGGRASLDRNLECDRRELSSVYATKDPSCAIAGSCAPFISALVPSNMLLLGLNINLTCDRRELSAVYFRAGPPYNAFA